MPQGSVRTLYGRWQQASPPYKRGGATVVDVVCTCGSGIKATKRLVILKTRPGGCGCIRRESTAARNRASAAPIPVGAVFGRLTTQEAPFSEMGYRRVRCACTCGKEILAHAGSLLSGRSASCGCLRSELVAEKNRTHGMTGTRMYSVWHSMLERCLSKACPSYKNYGGRGITVSRRWLKFENFYVDMGEPPFAGASIDRRDNSKGYSKSNCRWATRAEQAANTRRNKLYEFAGELLMLKDIATRSGVNLGALYYRVNTIKDSADKAVKHLTRNRKT